MVFMDKMKSLACELEVLGFRVTYPELTEEEKATGAETFSEYVQSLGGIEHVSPTDSIWNIKMEAMFAYKKVIDETDALLVCNFDKGVKKNHIGANVFLEMGYAFFTRKPIFILNEPPYHDEKIEEILGMQPIVLYGDITRLNLEYCS